MSEGGLNPDLAGKVIAASQRNLVVDVGAGKVLSGPEQKMMQAIAATPEEASRARAFALLAQFMEGKTLSPEQWAEVTKYHPNFAGQPAPPSTVAAAPADPIAKPDVEGLGSGEAFCLTAGGDFSLAAAKRYAKLYKGSEKKWRSIYQWRKKGIDVCDPCPLEDPTKMPAWWVRHMVWRVPTEIEQAAIDAARGRPAAPETAVLDAAAAQRPPEPAAATPVPAVPGPGSVQAAVDLAQFDPEEGDRLRELKQLQAAKFSQLTAALKAGEDTTVREQKYMKLCETVDNIETRATERMKKRGLFWLREDVERDLAANAELLRQMRESMVRRVLELCSSLTAEQRAEVTAAIQRTRGAEERVLGKLTTLKKDDLLRELAAA